MSLSFVVGIDDSQSVSVSTGSDSRVGVAMLSLSCAQNRHVAVVGQTSHKTAVVVLLSHNILRALLLDNMQVARVVGDLFFLSIETLPESNFARFLSRLLLNRNILCTGSDHLCAAEIEFGGVVADLALSRTNSWHLIPGSVHHGLLLERLFPLSHFHIE